MTTYTTARDVLIRLYRAAIEAVQPEPAVHAALAAEPPAADRPVHLIALGKAARPMLRAAQAWCAQEHRTIAGAICVSHEVQVALPLDGVDYMTGDHPLPGVASARAAGVLREYVRTRVDCGTVVLVLLSGGASSLIAAPVSTLEADTFHRCCDALLRSGLDIHAHNALRRQLTMWGNGRLASALQERGAHVSVLAVSDVPGDHLASIGSAPCLFTPSTTASNETLLAHARLATAEYHMLRDALAQAAPAQVQIAEVPHRIVSSNAIAREAVLATAAGMGYAVQQGPALLTGDAHFSGALVVRVALSGRSGRSVLCWGGEPVLALPPEAPAGGRMQALALAASREMHVGGLASQDFVILAAGTDGRDGTTDAAGAIVDASTWDAITASGCDPAAALAHFDSHSALRQVDALLPAFSSGTNVNDLVIVLVER